MTLVKAIEILTLDKNCEFEGNSSDLEAALQLGIEALKRVRENRKGGRVIIYQALPGETEE